jgi:glycosyltransferase involved in cell wall biosynthesis
MVSAGYCEGFGLPIIEAYCAGKLALASDVCAIPEVIMNKNHLFENEPEKLYQKILTVANGDMTVFNPELFRAYYKNNFSHEVIAERYKILYDN